MTDKSVTLSRHEYDAMLARIAELEDALDIARSRAGDDGTRVPHGVVRAEAEGARPVRAWRQYRGLSAREVAVAAGLTPGYLSEIETGRKPGSIAAFQALARALNVPIDLLIEDDAEPRA